MIIKLSLCQIFAAFTPKIAAPPGPPPRTRDFSYMWAERPFGKDGKVR
jgi:hypothetical protein